MIFGSLYAKLFSFDFYFLFLFWYGMEGCCVRTKCIDAKCVIFAAFIVVTLIIRFASFVVASAMLLYCVYFPLFFWDTFSFVNTI